MILRVKFNKRNYLKYIGHLDLLRLFQRTFKRGDIQVKYSKGFNPHPRFSIANPLSLGIEGEEEYMDVELSKRIDKEEFKDRMNSLLPKDIQIIDSIYSNDNKSIASKLSWTLYEISFHILMDLKLEDIERIIYNWLSNDVIMISRLRKKGKKKVMKEENIRPLIDMIEVIGRTDSEVIIQALIRVGENGNLRPFDFIDALSNIDELGMVIDSVALTRKSLYIEDEERIYKPM